MSARKASSGPKPPVVEVDAMDENEWEQGQHTPEVGTDKLTALVKESATRTPPAGVPTSSGRATAKTVKREVAVLNQDDIPTAPAPKVDPADLVGANESLATPSASARAATPTKPPPLPAASRPKSPSIAPAATSGANQDQSSATPQSDGSVSSSGATPSTGRTRSGSTTLSPTAFIRTSGDTVDPPTSLGPKVAPRISSSTKPPMLPLPRSAAAIALGHVPIAADANDLGIPASADDEDSSALAAYLSVPVGDERRARKRTLPPPPPSEFPIEEKPEEVVTAWRGPSPTTTTSIWSPKNVAIAGLAAALLIGALVVALGGGDDSKPTARTVETTPAETEKTVAAAPPAQRDTDENEIVIETPPPDTGSGSAASAPPTEATGTTTTTATATAIATTTTTTTATPETTPAPQKVSKFREQLDALLKNKEVVLEYDGRIGKNSAPASDQPAIAKARASHAAGTQRLNAGDFNGALDNYRRALSQYPGYVGSYRGMGLAYERKGDKGNALKALRMYVSVAPRATDVPALRKRIDALLE